MIFDWDARLFDRKRTLFSINGVGKTEYLYTKKRNWPFTIYIKINSKSIKDLNVSAKTIKTLRRKSGISSQLGLWQWFLAYDTKSKNRQWNYIRMKISCALRDTINRMREKFASHISVKGLISQYIKNSYKSATNHHHHPPHKRKLKTRTWIHIPPKKIYRWSISTWNSVVGKFKSKP